MHMLIIYMNSDGEADRHADTHMYIQTGKQRGGRKGQINMKLHIRKCSKNIYVHVLHRYMYIAYMFFFM